MTINKGKRNDTFTRAATSTSLLQQNKIKEALDDFKDLDPRCIDEIDELKKIFYNFFINEDEYNEIGISKTQI